MDSKFANSLGGWFFIDSPRLYGVGLWKNIRSG